MRCFELLLLRQIKKSVGLVESFIQQWFGQRVVDDVHEPHLLTSGDDTLRYSLATRPAQVPLGKVNDRDICLRS